MSEALRQLCGRGSQSERKLYCNRNLHARKWLSALFDQFHELGIDYVDVFWGWIELMMPSAQ